MLREIIVGGLATIGVAFSGILVANNPSFLPVRVARVIDGDTLDVRYDGVLKRVRLACIDAPELKQAPHGQNARKALASRIPVGAKIVIKVHETDRYGREIAEVYAKGINLNQVLVREGNAAVYRDYLTPCASSRSMYLDRELYAQERKLGIWNDENFIVPWEFRRQRG